MTQAKLERNLQPVLEAKINKLWKKVKPSTDAQIIRARLSVSFDSKKAKDSWLSDHAPDYVWDLIDIAAQWGIEHGKQK